MCVEIRSLRWGCSRFDCFQIMSVMGTYSLVLGCSSAVMSGLLDLVWFAAWSRYSSGGKVRSWVGGEEDVAAKLNQAGMKTTVLCQERECHNDRTDAVTNSCGLSVVQMRHSASL